MGILPWLVGQSHLASDELSAAHEHDPFLQPRLALRLQRLQSWHLLLSGDAPKTKTTTNNNKMRRAVNLILVYVVVVVVVVITLEPFFLHY